MNRSSARMQSVVAGCFLLLAFGAGVREVIAAPAGTTVLEQSTERTVLRLDWPAGTPVVDVQSFIIALPGPRAPRLNILSESSTSLPADASQGDLLPQESLVRVGAPARVRGVWRVTVTVAVRYRDSLGQPRRLQELRLALDHPSAAGEALPAPGSLFDDPARFLSTTAFLNPDAARAFRRASVFQEQQTQKRRVAGDSFSRSPRWLRVDLVETGVYRMRYEDLELLLQDEAAAIDPGTLRLLSATRMLQDLDPNAAGMSWESNYEMLERALHVQASAPAAGMGPGDFFLFYAPGLDTWTDRHDPSADVLDHMEHQYADHLSYWLCWERVGEDDNDFDSPPLRMAQRDVSPQAAAPRRVGDHRERLHLERAASMSYGILQDNWSYNLSPIRTGDSQLVPFNADHVVSDSTSQVYVNPVSLYVSGTPQIEVLFNASNLGLYSWSWSAQTGGALIRYEAEGAAPTEGGNVVSVINRNSLSAIGLDLVDIQYRRRLFVRDDRLEWLVYPDEVAPADTLLFDLGSDQGGLFDTGSYLLDTTQPASPVLLIGATVENGGAGLRFEDVIRGSGRPQHYAAYQSAGLLSPVGLRLGGPRLLRSEAFASGGWDYLIIGPEDLLDGFQSVADLRSQFLDDGAGNPLISPRVTMVDVQDIYDNFGHGVKEPAAIRNFLKFSYLNEVYGESGRQTEYVFFVGDASRDYRNRLPSSGGEQERDRCPTYIQTHWPQSNSFYVGNEQYVPYATDDWMGAFDEPDSNTGSLAPYDLGELGVGRAPVADLAEARLVADRIVEYVQDPGPGFWRNDMLLVCDDEVALANGAPTTEKFHIQEGELVSESILPEVLNVTKLYLTEYPNPPGPRNKPAARQEMRRSWSDGKLIVHYIGHGSPKQLADEKVFLIEDVAALTNVEQLPLFLAFSCDVAIYDSPVEKSMSEQLVLNAGGGAIAAIAASQISYVGPNNALTNAFYERLFPTQDPQDTPPLGAVLRDARVSLGSTAFTNHNSRKYVLFGDPALRLAVPSRGLQLSGALADSIHTGALSELTGAPLNPRSLNGRYELLSREARDPSGYSRIDVSAQGDTSIFHIDYVLDGSVFFHGVGNAQGDTISVLAPVPVQLRTGNDGSSLLLYSESTIGNPMQVGLAYPTPVEIRASSGDDVEGPLIQLDFSASSTTVVPGDTLHVLLQDPSGINVLGTSPASRINLDFDDSGFALDLTSLYQPEDDRYDQGALAYALPNDLEAGPHTLILSASDTKGNNSKASLSFTLKQDGALEIGGALAVPNPFQNSTRFAIELSEAASVELLIFTLDGRAIRNLQGVQPQRGVLVLDWDGTDFRGDQIANGAYLFTVRAEFLVNSMDPTLTLTRSGRVVKMR